MESWWTALRRRLLPVFCVFLSVALSIVGLQAAQATTQFSLMTPSFVPADSHQNNPLELGVNLSTSSTQNITELKYYKFAASSALHTAHVWDASGNLLATQDFVNETASGWQTLTLTSPVLMSAGSSFTVSVLSTDYYFPYDSFPAPVSGSPLTVLKSVYNYTSTAAFPQLTVGANYAVDLTVENPGPTTSSIIGLPTASSIDVGTALSGSTLSGGTGSVAGSFSFTSPTTVLTAGTHTVSITFTPTDQVNYLATSANISITVNALPSTTPSTTPSTPAAPTSLASTGPKDLWVPLSSALASSLIILGWILVAQSRRIPGPRRR